MTLKIDRKLFFFILILIASNVFLYRPLKAKREKVQSELNAKTAILEECVAAPEGLPSEEALENLRFDKEKLLNEYINEARYVLHPSINMAALPQDDNRWPLYFRKVLFQTTAELRGCARAKNVPIPSQFGFSTELPQKEDVVKLLTELGLVRHLIMVSAQSGVERVLLVSPLIKKEKPGEDKTPQKKPEPEIKEEQDLEELTKEVEKEVEKQSPEQSIKLSMLSQYPFIQEYPLLLKVNSDTKSLFRLLYELQKKDQFFLIRNIQIRRNPQDSSRVITDLLVSGLVEKLEEVKEEKKEEAEIDLPPGI